MQNAECKMLIELVDTTDAKAAATATLAQASRAAARLIQHARAVFDFCILNFEF
jgi:hypothetical protein